MREELKKLLEDTDMSQASIARSIGVSGAVISTWLKGEYKGDNKSLEEKLSNFIANSRRNNIKKELITAEIKPINDFLMAHFMMDEAVIGNDMALIYGVAGSGKTATIKEFEKTHPETVLIEAIPGMSISSFLKKLCEKLGVLATKSVEDNITVIVANLKNRKAVIIVDECENLTTRTLEAIRRIWDFSQTPTILVGTNILLQNLKGRSGELLQLYSRISLKWEFRGLGNEDLKLLFGEFSEDISKITTHLRRATNIYNKALRFASLDKEQLSFKHIKKAKNMVILD